MIHHLGIDSLTIFGMPPVDHVTLAADLRCTHISAALEPVPWKLDRFPQWSLRDDARLRREMMAAMRDRGIAIMLAEGFAVQPDVDARDRVGDLDLMAELGARAASAVSMEPDLPRALDQLATLADLTAERGMGFVIEFAPPHPINTLDKTLSAIRHIDRPGVKLVIDAMHFFRSGATVTELATIDPGFIGYVQLCDVPIAPQDDNYLREACFMRKCPGDGELPLRDLLEVIPDDVPIGLEVPMHAQAAAATDLRQLLNRCVEASYRLLDQTRNSA